MPSHYDVTAEEFIPWIKACHYFAFGRSKKSFQDGAALRVKVVRYPFPIHCLNPLRNTAFHIHVRVSRSSSERLRSTPQRYPDNPPSLRTTRWQGMATASALAAHAWATARTDRGDPICAAISA